MMMMCMNSTATLYLTLYVIDTKINSLLYRKSSQLLITASVTYDTWLSTVIKWQHIYFSACRWIILAYWRGPYNMSSYYYVYINRVCLRRWLISIYRKMTHSSKISYLWQGKEMRTFTLSVLTIYCITNCDT